MMTRNQIAELEKRVLIPTYDRMPILAVRGEGCYVYDDEGKKYLDFLGGLAVNSLGYDHPEIMATLRDPVAEPPARFQPSLPSLPGAVGGKVDAPGGNGSRVLCQFRHGGCGGRPEAGTSLRAQARSSGARSIAMKFWRLKILSTGALLARFPPPGPRSIASHSNRCRRACALST